MAIKFENVTKIPATFWMRHQQRYDEFKTREKLKVAVFECILFAFQGGLPNSRERLGRLSERFV